MEELVTLFTYLLNKIFDDFGKGNTIFQCIWTPFPNYEDFNNCFTTIWVGFLTDGRVFQYDDL